MRTWWKSRGRSVANRTGSGAARHWIAELDGEPFAFAQCYRTDLAPPGPWSGEPPGTLGIDFCLGRAEDLGRGLGSALLRAFVRHLLDRLAPARIVADPDLENVASCRALEAAGFVLDEASGIWALEPGPRGAELGDHRLMIIAGVGVAEVGHQIEADRAKLASRLLSSLLA